MRSSFYQKLKSESPVLLAVSLCVLLFGIAFSKGVDSWTGGAEIRSELERYRTLIQSESGYGALKTEISSRQEKLQAQLDTLTHEMHDQKDLSGLLQMLFDIAWQHEIKIDKTTPQSEVAGNEVVRYPIVLEMNTSYHQLGNFISSLERIPHILRIDRLALTLEKTGNIKAHMRVTCFANRTGEQ